MGTVHYLKPQQRTTEKPFDILMRMLRTRIMLIERAEVPAALKPSVETLLEFNRQTVMFFSEIEKEKDTMRMPDIREHVLRFDDIVASILIP